MPTPGAYLHNVMVEVYTFTYNTELRRPILNTTPVATGLYGHLQSIMLSLENKMAGNIDNDRVSRFRLFLETSRGTDEFVTHGNLIKITKMRDKNTKAWVDVDPPAAYQIDFAEEDITSSYNKTVSLIKYKTQ